MQDGRHREPGRGGSPLPEGRFALLLVAGAVVTIFLVLLINR
jgi:hypothetical protein